MTVTAHRSLLRSLFHEIPHLSAEVMAVIVAIFAFFNNLALGVLSLTIAGANLVTRVSAGGRQSDSTPRGHHSFWGDWSRTIVGQNLNCLPKDPARTAVHFVALRAAPGIASW